MVKSRAQQVVTPAIASLDIQAWAAGQDANYTEVLKCGGFTFRVTIHADTSYKVQSRAHIEILDGFTWREVARIMPALVRNEDVSHYVPGSRLQHANIAGFQADRRRLLRLALATLSMEGID